MNSHDSTTTYRQQVRDAREPIERGSQKYAELIQAFAKRDDAHEWINLIETLDPFRRGEMYFMEVFPKPRFAGAYPDWADLSITDFAIETDEFLPIAGWARYLVQTDMVDVQLARQDVYDPDSGEATVGPVELYVGIEGAEGFRVSSPAVLRQIAAAFLNAADEFDRITGGVEG